MIKGFFKPQNIYVFDEDTLNYESVKKKKSGLILLISLIFFIGVIVGHYVEIEYKNIVEKNTTYRTSFDDVIGSIEWKDSIFADYEKKASLYLSQEQFKGTPIKSDMLSLAARNAYDSTGIIVPLELALAQAQWESDMGRKGRSPVNNPFNVGEWETGTVMYFESTFEGIQAYYYLMVKSYLRCKSINELFKNFTNCAGNRYASNNYESIIREEFFSIKQWIEKNYVE
mgnify:CR=1 FL=1